MKKIIFTALALASTNAFAASYVVSTPATKTATIVVDVVQNSPAGSLNFNDQVRGQKSFTVPAGWNVVMKFRNMGSFAHSAVVVKGTTPPASVSEKNAAFPGAATRMVVKGLGMNAAETVKFRATTAGQYLIICGVPGHGLGGQYLGLKVVAGAKAATYK